jgi:hypothetical protein
MVSLRLDPVLWNRVRSFSLRKGISIASIVEAAAKAFLQKELLGTTL